MNSEYFHIQNMVWNEFAKNMVLWEAQVVVSSVPFDRMKLKSRRYRPLPIRYNSIPYKLYSCDYWVVYGTSSSILFEEVFSVHFYVTGFCSPCSFFLLDWIFDILIWSEPPSILKLNDKSGESDKVVIHFA